MISTNDSQYPRSRALDAALSSETPIDARPERELGIAPPSVELDGKPTPRSKRPLAARALALMVWPYALGVTGTWLLLWYAGDRWWFATLMLFGPRWIYGLPLVLLVPLAAIRRRRLLWLLAPSVVVLVVPIMGFCIPWSNLAPSDGPTIRVVTWNVRNDCVDSENLATLIENVKPDIVALQECREDVQFDWPAGWHVHRQGRLVTGSRHPIDSIGFSQRHHTGSERPPVNALHCAVKTPIHCVAFVNVHLLTPRQGLSEVLDRQTVISPSRSGTVTDEIELRRRESEDVAKWVSGFAENAVIAGDFNMPSDSLIYRQSWPKYVNAFSVAGFGFGYTKKTEILGWQYQSRIDHVLAGPGWRPHRCWVGPDLGSDHLPLIAELAWDGARRTEAVGVE